MADDLTLARLKLFLGALVSVKGAVGAAFAGSAVWAVVATHASTLFLSHAEAICLTASFASLGFAALAAARVKRAVLTDLTQKFVGSAALDAVVLGFENTVVRLDQHKPYPPPAVRCDVGAYNACPFPVTVRLWSFEIYVGQDSDPQELLCHTGASCVATIPPYSKHKFQSLLFSINDAQIVQRLGKLMVGYYSHALVQVRYVMRLERDGEPITVDTPRRSGMAMLLDALPRGSRAVF